MSDTDNKPVVDPTRLEVDIGGGGATSGSFERDGKSSVSETDDEGLGVDFNSDGTMDATGLDKQVKFDGDVEGEGDEDPDAKPEGDEEAGEAADPELDLGEYKADDPEVSAKFDAKYFTEDGTKLNLEAFGPELSANMEKGVNDLNAGTREYLKDRLGLSDEAITNHINGQIALGKQNEEAFYSLTEGGKEVYEQTLAWARGVYTDEQKARFNEALKKGGDAAKEAVELLNSRAGKAGFKPKDADGKEETTTPQRKGPPGKRPASPARDATTKTSTSSGPAVKPFANAQEHQKAQTEAVNSKDPAKLAEVRRRAAVSTFWRNS